MEAAGGRISTTTYLLRYLLYYIENTYMYVCISSRVPTRKIHAKKSAKCIPLISKFCAFWMKFNFCFNGETM